MVAFAIRFLLEDDGQDLVEYGLLAAIFAIAAALIFPYMVPVMNSSYTNHANQINNAWIPNDPIP